MPTDVLNQLRDLGCDLRRDSAPITFDDIVGSEDRTGAFAPSFSPNVGGPARRTKLSWVAAAAALAAAVVGLVVVAERPDADPFAEQPTPATLPEPAAPAGALIVDGEMPNWQLAGASVDRQAGDPVFVRRVYMTDNPRPEDGPSITVDSFDADAGSPLIDDASTGTISVRGLDAYLFDHEPAGRGLAFESDGFWYSLAAYGLSDDQLAAAAEATRRADDGYGAVIDDAGLPDGLVAEAVGVEGESWFLSRTAIDNPIANVRWENGSSSLWLQSFQQDPALDRFQRIGAATVTDTTVNGQPAFIRTLPGNPDFRSITWHADGRTHSLGSLGVDQEQLTQFAEALRPATAAEWDEALAAVAPPTACIGADCTALPEPGSVVPAGVAVFPVIDEALVPNDGRGATYADFLYFPEDRGPIWVGVLGEPDTDVYDDVITVQVSAAADAEPGQMTAGRSPEVGESDYGSGFRLVKSATDGTAVSVIGRSIDQLYAVLDHIAPTVSAGQLSGYQLSGELPDGLSELVSPQKQAFEQGSFPWLNLHGGVLNIRIAAGPALPQVSGVIGPLEQLTVIGRPALFFASINNDYAQLAIDLSDGNSMVLSGDAFSREELVGFAENVEFVDEQNWKDRYGAAPAVIPRIEETVETTIAVSESD